MPKTVHHGYPQDLSILAVSDIVVLPVSMPAVVVVPGQFSSREDPMIIRCVTEAAHARAKETSFAVFS